MGFSGSSVLGAQSGCCSSCCRGVTHTQAEADTKSMAGEGWTMRV